MGDDIIINEIPGMTVTITVHLSKRFRLRLWAALRLFSLGARLFPGSAEVVTEVAEEDPDAR
jgi:hypothetical protein